jgi:hypothetical protein
VQGYRHNSLNHSRYNDVEYLTNHYPDRNHRQTPYCRFRYHVGSLFEMVRNPPAEGSLFNSFENLPYSDTGAIEFRL